MRDDKQACGMMKELYRGRALFLRGLSGTLVLALVAGGLTKTHPYITVARVRK
jgi:hypothetical protein